MSGTGSPADRTDTVDNSNQGGAPAGAPADKGAPQDRSGDANLSASPSSGDGDTGATKEPKPTLADVIKTAAALPDAQGTSPAPAKDGTEKVDTAAPVADGANGEQDDTKLPFHNHPRWKEVIAQNNQFKADVEKLKPDAEQFGKIQSFMDEHHLSHDEVGDLFIVGAMAKAGDPRALQKIDEFRDKVASAIGEKIPADIQAQIESGEITEAAGKELSKARAEKAISEKRESDRTANDQRTREQNDASALATAQSAAVTAWEVEQKKTDPDFAKKEKAVARYARALMQEKGMPTTAEAAVSLIKAAYAEVNKDFASLVPLKQPVSRVPSAPSSHGAKEAPKSLLDAVRQAASK